MYDLEQEISSGRRSLRLDKITTGIAFGLLAVMEGWFIEADAPLVLTIGIGAIALGSGGISRHRMVKQERELNELEEVKRSEAAAIEAISTLEVIDTNKAKELWGQKLDHQYSPPTLREFIGLDE